MISPSDGCKSDLPLLVVAGVISPCWWLQESSPPLVVAGVISPLLVVAGVIFPSDGCKIHLPPLVVARVISPLWWLQVKCEQYWPPHEGSSVTFGRYTITSIKVTEKAHFTHRMLDITKDPSQVIYVGADSVRV